MTMNQEPYTAAPVLSVSRKSTWADLMMIWTAATICLPAFIIGAFLVREYGWDQASAVNLWGNLLVGLMIAAGGAFGVRTGQPSAVMGRYVFGRGAGQWLPVVCLWVSMVGWSAIMLDFTGQLLSEMLFQWTGFSSPILMMLVLGLVFASTAVGGYERIRGFSWLVTPLLLLICGWIFYRLDLMIPAGQSVNLTLHTLPPGSGMDVVVGGSVAGAIMAADYSRHAVTPGHHWLGTLAGVVPASVFLGFIGMLSQTLTGDWNPLPLLSDAAWLTFPFILAAAWTTNDNLLYSSGLALSRLLPGFRRRTNTLLCTFSTIALAVLGITGAFEQWLTGLAMLLSSLLGVLLSHMIWVKGEYPGNTNWKALLSVAVGVAAGWQIPGHYMTSLSVLAIAGLSYLLLLKAGRR